MVLESTGVVLKSVSYSESSLISRIYTNEFGKLSFITRGAKRIKGGKSGILQPMNIIEFQMNFNHLRELQILQEVSIIHNLVNLRSNIKKMAVGLVMVEILDKTTQVMDKSEILFRLIKKSLITLNNQKLNNMLLLIFFRLQFSKYSGFNPIPKSCQQCDIVLEKTFYNQKEGTLYCNKCQNSEGMELSKQIYETLKNLSNTHISKLNTMNINAYSIQTIETYLTQFMIYHLHGMYNIKSIKFLNEVFPIEKHR